MESSQEGAPTYCRVEEEPFWHLPPYEEVHSFP